MTPKYIVIHNNGVAGRTIENIRRTHKNRGWSDVGYHYVVHEDGVIHRGRPEHKAGAHTRGLNTKSLGVCLIGNGNKADFNQSQYIALRCKLLELMVAYDIPVERVIGHRETRSLVPKRYRTRKQCPGRLVDMDRIRRMVAGAK